MARHYKQDNPPKRYLSRRAMLRGVGGAAIALPLLELMLEDKVARAAPPPKRFLVCFHGQSTGADGDPVHNYIVPDTIGPSYDLKTALAPFAEYDAAKDISVISGLSIPTANGGAIPAGGRADDFHINSLSPLFSGMSTGDGNIHGATSDQIVAAAFAGATNFESLVYRVQAGWYLSVSAPYGRDIMSVKDESGSLVEIPAQVSPKAAFDSLFYNFAPSEDPAEAAAQDFAWRQRKSVLDLVKKRADALVQKLGGADRQRLERHLDEIRDLEMRVAAIPPVAGGNCMLPMDPGGDPTLGGDQGTDANGENTYSQNLGYSGEEQRARVFCDLVHMAFTCDLARVGSLMFTMAQSHLNMFELTGQATDLHEVGHNGVPGGTAAVAQAQAWHLEHFAYLVAKLRDTTEVDGSVLDNCAIVYLFEGGHGHDPSTGELESAHSTENMVALTAGRAGGLVAGEHIVADGMHPANVLITAMNAAGVATTTLGEVSGTIDGLLT